MGDTTKINDLLDIWQQENGDVKQHNVCMSTKNLETWRLRMRIDAEHEDIRRNSWNMVNHLRLKLTGAKRREFSGNDPLANYQQSSQQPPATHPATLRLARTSK